MTAKNFDRALAALHRRRPFRRFTVELVSGSRFQVDHPEALVVRGGTAVFIAADGTPILFDHESVSQFIGEASSRTTRS